VFHQLFSVIALGAAMHAPFLIRCVMRIRAAGCAWWRRWGTDDPTAYLSQSVDHVDLAYRIQRWNEAERHDRKPLL
jgi:hypothetical protein